MAHGFECGQEHVRGPEFPGLEAERDDLVLLRGRTCNARPLIGADPKTVDAEAFDNRPAAGPWRSGCQSASNFSTPDQNRHLATMCCVGSY
jgi:hypothetical protein